MVLFFAGLILGILVGLLVFTLLVVISDWRLEQEVKRCLNKAKKENKDDQT